VRDAFRAGDRHDVITLCDDPGKRHLRRRCAARAGDAFDDRDQSAVRLGMARLEARDLLAEVIGRQIFRRGDRTGQEAAAERTEGNKADAEFGAGRKRAIGFATMVQSLRAQGVLSLVPVRVSKANTRFAAP
jgi:hypothetical protein